MSANLVCGLGPANNLTTEQPLSLGSATGLLIVDQAYFLEHVEDIRAAIQGR